MPKCLDKFSWIRNLKFKFCLFTLVAGPSVCLLGRLNWAPDFICFISSQKSTKKSIKIVPKIDPKNCHKVPKGTASLKIVQKIIQKKRPKKHPKGVQNSSKTLPKKLPQNRPKNCLQNHSKRGSELKRCQKNKKSIHLYIRNLDFIFISYKAYWMFSSPRVHNDGEWWTKSMTVFIMKTRSSSSKYTNSFWIRIWIFLYVITYNNDFTW